MGIETIIRRTLLIAGFSAGLHLFSADSQARLYAPDWDISLRAQAEILSSSMMIGAGKGPATDGYDLRADILQPPLPPALYGIRIFTVEDNRALLADYKSNTSPKEWDIILGYYNPFYDRMIAETVLEWKMNAVPSNNHLILIDYGADYTRKNEIYRLDMRSIDSYMFIADTSPGNYRFLTIHVNPEPASFWFVLTGMIMVYGGRRGCKE